MYKVGNITQKEAEFYTLKDGMPTGVLATYMQTVNAYNNPSCVLLIIFP
jgi:hypothetical protein